MAARYHSGTANRNGATPAAVMDEANRRNSFVKRQNAIKRQSDSFDVQLIGKFESNNAQALAGTGGVQANGGINQSATLSPTERGFVAPGIGMDDGTPVVAELRTNVIVSPGFLEYF